MSKAKQGAAEVDASDRILITVEEAARRLSIGRSHLYEHLMRGTLRSVRIGRSRRISTHDLDAFVDALLNDSADTLPVINTGAPIRSVKKALVAVARRR